APPPFAERRVTYRRAADHDEHREKVLLARTLDLLASDDDAETRLAGVLELLARTVGARRAAVVADGVARRVAVAAVAGESDDGALALGAWLDSAAVRTRAERAATLPAPIFVAVGSAERGQRAAKTPQADGTAAPAAGAPPPSRPPSGPPGLRPTYALLGVPGSGRVTLGFEFADARSAARLDDRLPRALARHAAVALALVTEGLHVERELAALHARDDARTRFVSTVAHELRTPLTGLSGYLELLLGGQVEDPLVEREFLERGRSIVETMDALVGDLLEVSRLDSGSLRLDVGQFSVADVATRVASSLLPIALERGTELRTDLPPRLRAATGDRRRVEQIVTNLAANALKFSSEGAIELVAWFDGPVALIVVRDGGAGIAAGDLTRIFERFYRMAGHERITGTGLGLPIARDLARAMGGDLDVASVAGSGSSFVLAMPGPRPVENEQLATALRMALAAEKVMLEERALVRGASATGRAEQPRPSLRHEGGRGVDSGPDDAPKGGRARVSRRTAAAETAAVVRAARGA
ncbi:MAG: HAMP domain-containing histidine kinase, partial [Chloroflexi bacterium]|nr:HAMP domain-containing histidine kinase [Chloroflexota bacterium]